MGTRLISRLRNAPKRITIPLGLASALLIVPLWSVTTPVGTIDSPALAADTVSVVNFTTLAGFQCHEVTTVTTNVVNGGLTGGLSGGLSGGITGGSTTTTSTATETFCDPPLLFGPGVTPRANPAAAVSAGTRFTG